MEYVYENPVFKDTSLTVLEYIKETAEHMTLNDGKKEETVGDFEFRPVGMGLQDMPAIVKAAEESGTEWVVVEMDSPSLGLTPLECIEKSAAYLKTIL